MKNKLIAEFMEYKLITPEMRKNPETWNESYWELHNENGRTVLCADSHLEYHCMTWNFLMKVVNKIEELGYFVMINKWTSVYTGKEDSSERIEITSISGKTKIENTKEAIVHFIQTYK